MSAPRPISIRRKLRAAVLGSSILVLLLSCGAFVWYEVVTFRANLTSNLQIRAAMIAANSTAALAFQNPADATDVLAAIRADDRMIAAGIYDSAGRIFATYPPDAPRALFPAAPDRSGHRFVDGHVVLFVPVAEDGRELGTVYLRSDLSALSERYRVYTTLVLSIVLSTLFLASLLSQWLQRSLATPILELTATARAVTEQKEYSLRAAKSTDDEIGVLTDSFNEMLAQIQKRDSSLLATQAEVSQLNAELEQRVAERTAQLASANKELEAFSYSVSHDLRAPLRAIDGFSLALLEDYGEKVDEGAKHYLQRVREGAKRMNRLIDDLLRFSQISRKDLHRKPVDLTALAREVAAELREAQPERVVSLEIAEGLGAAGDPELLRVVLVNLIGNAWKYTSKHASAKIEFGATLHDGRPAFFVRDDGAGFSMEYADLLFTPFQRLHGTADFDGTGVGLATVHRIIERHGGQLAAESAPEQGATFFFTIGSG